MKWRRNREASTDIIDRRRSKAATGAKVGGASLLAVIAAIFFGGNVFGGDSGFDLNGSLGGVGGGQNQATPDDLAAAPDPDADLKAFMGFVIDDVQETWTGLYQQAGSQYTKTQMVIFTDATQSGCGTATSAIGPHYCPRDQLVYLDFEFFQQLENRFGAPGDFAQAYVVAHEIGHHVQNISGIMDEVRRLQQANPNEANELSVRLELQADCLAGVWANSTYTRGNLSTGDLEEGMRAAASVGDDRIQQQATGTINPESWTHGSSEQRTKWFRRGFDVGDASRCDSFSGGI